MLRELQLLQTQPIPDNLSIQILAQRRAWYTIQYPDGKTAKVCGKSKLISIVYKHHLETLQKLQQETLDEVTRLKLELAQANQTINKLNEEITNVQSQSTLHNQTSQQVSVQRVQCDQDSIWVPANNGKPINQESSVDQLFEGGATDDSSVETKSGEHRESLQSISRNLAATIERKRGNDQRIRGNDQRIRESFNCLANIARISIEDQLALVDRLEQSEQLSIEPNTIDVFSSRVSDDTV